MTERFNVEVFFGRGLQAAGGLTIAAGGALAAWAYHEVDAGNPTAPSGVFGGLFLAAVGAVLVVAGWVSKRRGKRADGTPT